jgi:hypothetical protein
MTIIAKLLETAFPNGTLLNFSTVRPPDWTDEQVRHFIDKSLVIHAPEEARSWASLSEPEWDTALHLGIIRGIRDPDTGYRRNDLFNTMTLRNLTDEDRRIISENTMLTRKQAAERRRISVGQFDRLRKKHSLEPAEYVDVRYVSFMVGYHLDRPTWTSCHFIDEVKDGSDWEAVRRDCLAFCA